MIKSSPRRTPIATAVSVAIATITLTPAVVYAEETIEEVVVTGVRGSLMQSMDRKRDAKGVVDAITAEDIGKFPDQNLAEALQRITGVSIDRSNNEGSQITVRGMGPEFNLVTLNGRSMPTAGGRSFEFNDIATEGVSAVEIYKTPRADLPTGGIGATVNIITARPLDKPGMRAVISGKAVHETSASDSDVGDLDEYTPEIAGMYSNTFGDDRFGILITGSYQERDNREENSEVAFWTPNGQLNGGIVNNNNQRADGTWWHPQNVGYGWSDISRDRINGQLVLQAEPSDNIRITLDYTYSQVDFEKDTNSVGIWFECPNVEATVNARGTVTEVSQACGDFSTNIARDNTEKTNDSLGLNIEWMATESLSFELDAHSSSSEDKGAGIGGEPGSAANLIIGNTSCDWCGFVPGAGPSTDTIALQTARYGASGIPTYDVSFQAADGTPIDGIYGRESIGSLFGQAFNKDVSNDIDQIKISGTWDNLDAGAITRIDFGYQRTKQEFEDIQAYSGQLAAGFWLTSAQYWDGDAFELSSFNGLLDDFSGGGNFSFSNYYTLDFNSVVNGFETIAVDPADPVGNLYWPSFWGSDFQEADGSRGRFWSGPLGNDGISIVEETIDSFFTQVTMEDEFNGMPINARLGLRYEKTEIESEGLERPAEAIVWVSGNEFRYEFATDQTFRDGEGDNDFWLPSIDVDMEVRDGMKARLSYSRSLARPPVADLTANRAFEGNPNVGQRLASSGNPDLLPYLSDNLDVSFEWYYGEGSYASITYFKKKVDNFLVSTTVEETFVGLLDPYIGANAVQARADLEAEGTSPTDQAVHARINENLGVPITNEVFAAGGDPEAVFRVTTTENAEVGNLFGWEFAVQHMFGETGWGVQVNYTVVNGDVDADRDVIDQEFALPGLSDSGNLVVFYENNYISARVAYNWRDEFLSGFDGFGSPVFTEEYDPIDLNVTYFFNENMTFFFEAINITEEAQRSYIRYEEQFQRGNQYGSRFNLGMRYDF